MPPIRLITFDATNTILRLPCVSETYIEAAKKFGIIANGNNVRKSFFKEKVKLDKTAPNFGVAVGKTPREWWRELVCRSFIGSGVKDSKELHQTAEYLYDYYAKGNSWSLVENTVETLDKLKKNNPNTTFGILSNFDERLNSILKDLKLDHYFEFMVLSTEVGCHKPDPKIFQICMDKVKVKPAEYCHIGDSFKKDYLGAKDCGMSAILIADNIKVIKEERASLDDVVLDLDEIPGKISARQSR